MAPPSVGVIYSETVQLISRRGDRYSALLISEILGQLHGQEDSRIQDEAKGNSGTEREMLEGGCEDT